MGVNNVNDIDIKRLSQVALEYEDNLYSVAVRRNNDIESVLVFNHVKSKCNEETGLIDIFVDKITKEEFSKFIYSAAYMFGDCNVLKSFITENKEYNDEYLYALIILI